MSFISLEFSFSNDKLKIYAALHKITHKNIDFILLRYFDGKVLFRERYFIIFIVLMEI